MRNEKRNPSTLAAIQKLENAPAIIKSQQTSFSVNYANYHASKEKDKKLQKQYLIHLLEKLLKKIYSLSEQILNPPVFEEEKMRWRFIEYSATLYQDSLKIVLEDISKNLTPSLISKEISDLYDACEKKLTEADRFIQAELTLIRTFVPAEIEAKAGSRFTDYARQAAPSIIKTSDNSQTFFGKIKAFFRNEKPSSACLAPKN